jgi:hypothetical protein
MAEQQPQMNFFVSRRNITVRSTQGAAISFEKGVPTHVPRHLQSVVAEKGILPCDAKGVELDIDAVAAAVQPDEKPAPSGPETAEERQDAIKGAIKGIVKRNASADFGAGGTPRADAVTLALGWRVDQKEVRQAWVAMRPDLLNPGGKRD